MTHTIRVPKPADPLVGILTSPARRWRPRECWGIQPEETPVRRSVAETEAFDRLIRKILFWKEVQ